MSRDGCELYQRHDNGHIDLKTILIVANVLFFL